MQALTRLFERRGRIVHFFAEDVIFSRGTEIMHVYRVQSGTVMLHSSSLAGREIGFELLRAGDFFGMVPNLQRGIAGVDATALSECDLLAVDREAFADAIRTDIELTHEALQVVAMRLARRTKQAEELALFAVRGRLARYVIGLAQQQNGSLRSEAKVRLAFSQKIMAAMAGISRETLNRQFRSWIEAGVVSLEGKELRILRPDHLIAFAGAAYD
ncbi:Crp/Fnr family transcriptional regulator [Rhodopseudomonas sp. B29]|uniref:Crp/Fnr family transcriptional regulator n=1 Tax=Rhodopseudomonas sp. B29 TaxID=95607 RepID=UPI0003B6BF73|nr:Crp/Fnr family transcriptional regulator [Rhodopseudomonas sp. B29]